MKSRAVFNTNTQALECHQCGTSKPVTWPLEARVVGELFVGFAREHEKCSEEYALWKRDPQASGEGTI